MARAITRPSGSLREQGAHLVALYYLKPPAGAAAASFERHAKSTPFTVTHDKESAAATAQKGAATVLFIEPPIDKVPPPSAHELESFGRGLSPDERAQLPNLAAVSLLVFSYAPSAVDASLKQADQLAYDVARDTHAYLFDGDTRELFTVDAWRDLRLAGWHQEAPIARNHVTVHAYKRDTGFRAVSLGMLKLGLPDVAIDGFDATDTQPIDVLMERLLQTLVASPTVTAKGELALPMNATETLLVPLVWGVRADGDAQNRLLELALDGDGPRHDQLARILDRLRAPTNPASPPPPPSSDRQ